MIIRVNTIFYRMEIDLRRWYNYLVSLLLGFSSYLSGLLVQYIATRESRFSGPCSINLMPSVKYDYTKVRHSQFLS